MALAAGLGVGLVAGWLNGFITVRMKVSPLIATLGTFSAFTGLGLIITGGYPIFGLNQLNWVGQEHVLGVQMPASIMLGLFGLLTLVMGSTIWGVRLLAVGGNIEGARRAGVRVDRYLWGAFIVCGLCAALAGLVMFGNTEHRSSRWSGDEVINTMIAIVALAGVLLTGGGGPAKVLVGALILGTIKNGLTLLDVPSYWQLLTTGVLLVGAVWLDGALSRAIELRRTMASASSDPAIR